MKQNDALVLVSHKQIAMVYSPYRWIQFNDRSQLVDTMPMAMAKLLNHRKREEWEEVCLGTKSPGHTESESQAIYEYVHYQSCVTV